MREKVLEEILATEKSYVKTLQDIIQVRVTLQIFKGRAVSDKI